MWTVCNIIISHEGFCRCRVGSCFGSLARGRFRSILKPKCQFPALLTNVPLWRMFEKPFQTFSIDDVLRLWRILATFNVTKYKKGDSKAFENLKRTTLEWTQWAACADFCTAIFQRPSNRLEETCHQTFGTCLLTTWEVSAILSTQRENCINLKAFSSSLSLVLFWVCSILICIVSSNQCR